MEVLLILTEVPVGYINECCTRTRTHTPVFYEASGTIIPGISHCFSDIFTLLKDGYGYGMSYPYPGYCGAGVQDLQKFRVRV